ncbi:MAG TPA: hypothetical protein VMI33_15495 [Streptosporangiaceae bacterium]|nr:hypothetical protein [Streptosporangiaceae bacterium]
MGELRCVDGSVLTVVAVACRDRTGRPYEITLDLRRGRRPFASVGERCGFRLAQLAAGVTEARADPAQALAWPDPDDRFPGPGPPGEGFRPGEREYFSLRAREPGDLPGRGELRCVLRDSAEWRGGEPQGAGRAGGWCLTRRAVIEAWGTDGTGLRAVLTSAELVTFLDTVLKEPDDALAARWAPAGAKATIAGIGLATLGRSSWRQRGKVRDESTRSRLPALRAQNRSVAFAAGDPAARRGDVRR